MAEIARRPPVDLRYNLSLGRISWCFDWGPPDEPTEGMFEKRQMAAARHILAALARGPDAIDEGGYIPHTDYSCPPDITFSNSCYYLQRFRDICNH